MERKHPPIPVHSPHFDANGWFYLQCGEVVCNIASRRWREIIASVARSAWLDESDRLHEESAKHFDKRYPLEFSKQPKKWHELNDASGQAYDNSLLWRNWAALCA